MAIKLRFAPPRTAIRVAVTDVRDGDWAYLSGYWWRVRNVRATEVEGMNRCDLNSPRGDHVSVWCSHLIEARCDG